MEQLRTPLARFLALSLAIHSLILFLWPKAQIRQKTPVPITLSLAEESSPVSSGARKQTAARQSKEPAALAKKSLASAEERGVRQTLAHKEKKGADKATQSPKASGIIAKSSLPDVEEKPIAQRETMIQKEPNREEPAPPPREPTKEKSIITERTIPSVKELLPPFTWSPAGRSSTGKEGPLRLDTKDPQYVTYFGSIKRDIELVWEYPEQALRYGLQGKLLLEFSILSSGELESAKIVRSSGSHLLDQEALRAVKAAAPFKPIPPWIDKSRIDLVASFEYLDNRVNYRFMP